jgi:hypothetical protein
MCAEWLQGSCQLEDLCPKHHAKSLKEAVIKLRCRGYNFESEEPTDALPIIREAIGETVVSKAVVELFQSHEDLNMASEAFPVTLNTYSLEYYETFDITGFFLFLTSFIGRRLDCRQREWQCGSCRNMLEDVEQQ